MVTGMKPVRGITAGGTRITFRGRHLDAFVPLGAYFTPPESTGLPALYGFADNRSDSRHWSFAHRSKGRQKQWGDWPTQTSQLKMHLLYYAVCLLLPRRMKEVIRSVLFFVSRCLYVMCAQNTCRWFSWHLGKRFAMILETGVLHWESWIQHETILDSCLRSPVYSHNKDCLCMILLLVICVCCMY